MAKIACGKSIFKNKLLYLMKWKIICEKNNLPFQEEQKHDYLLFIPFFHPRNIP